MTLAVKGLMMMMMMMMMHVFRKYKIDKNYTVI